MTAVLDRPVVTPKLRAPADTPAAARRNWRSPRRIVVAAVAFNSLLVTLFTTLTSVSTSPFQDEGLYVYMGHRMAQHLWHGSTIIEHPSAYLSGSPMVYPPLAAIADTIGGLGLARNLSLLFIVVAGVMVYLTAAQLFGRLAGVIAQLAFLCNGSVLFQAHLATFDAMALCIVSIATWVAVRSAQRNGLLYGFLAGGLLALAFLTKYMTAVYVPIVAVIAVAAGWSTWRWVVVQRAAVMVFVSVALVFFYIELFAREIWVGIVSTTFSRAAMAEASTGSMVTTLLGWAAPWLVGAAVAVVIGSVGPGRRLLVLRLALLGGAIAAPLGQMRMHEMTSFSKHLAFGMVFAAPLVGELFAMALRKTRGKAAPTVAAFLVLAVSLGVVTSREFLTGWIDDRPLIAPLSTAIAASPGKVVLAEVGSAERYELRQETGPRQWADTYSFSYSGLTGVPAYEKAIEQSHFGVIYLSMTTVNGQAVHEYLISHATPYILSEKVPRYLRGELVGSWLLFTPRVAG